MANVTSKGLDELTRELNDFAGIIPEISEEILEKVGEVYVDEWKEGIERYKHVDTGDMRDSVKAKVNESEKSVTISPTGKDRKGVDNAKKAYVNHYGTSSRKGDRFVDDIEEKGTEKAVKTAEEIFFKKLEEKGFL